MSSSDSESYNSSSSSMSSSSSSTDSLTSSSYESSSSSSSSGYRRFSLEDKPIVEKEKNNKEHRVSLNDVLIADPKTKTEQMKRVSLTMDIMQKETLRKTTKSSLSSADMEFKNYHTMKIEEISKELGTSVDMENVRKSIGLTQKQIDQKHADGETNTVTPPKRTPEWLKLLLQFTNPFMVLLMIAAVLCLVVYGIDPLKDKTNIYIAALLFFVVFVTCIMSYIEERQTDKVMETFNSILASNATVIRDGKHVEINASDIVTGDLIILRAGEKCAGDVRLIDVDGLQSDNSAMTGESEPVNNTTKASSEVAVHSTNMCWSGALIVDGGAVGIVTSIGDNTLIGKVAKLASATNEKKSLLEIEIMRFVKIVTALSIVLAVLLLILGFSRKMKTTDVIITAISVILANVPQGLPPAVTTVLSITARALQTKHVFVKRLDIVETLGSCSVIASDKTGTLTQNKMTSKNTWCSRGKDQALTPAEADNSESMRQLARVLILCNRIVVDANVSDVSNMTFSADASEIGLFKRAFEYKQYHRIRAAYPKVAEIPFNSVHKWQLSVHRLPADELKDFPSAPRKIAEEAFLLVIKGAPEIILNLCGSYYDKDAQLGKCTEAHKDYVKAQITAFASQGERVLGFAVAYINKTQKKEIEESRELPASVNELLCFAGLNTLLDPPKEGVAEAVLQCMSAGIKVIMVTGDFPITAQAIAKQVNIFSDKAPPNEQGAYTGKDVLEFKDEDWETVLAKPRLVFARMQPEHKLMIVEHLQKRGEVVAVTGDGVNDSPALKRADVGIAMGIAGTEVAKEAAKIICTDDNFASIVEGIRYGRIIFDNLYKIIMLVITHLIPEAWPFLYVYIFTLPLGLTPLLLLTIDLGTEMLPSISLAYEGPESDIMNLPPRDLKRDRLVTFFSLSHCYIEFGNIETLLCTALYLHILMGYYHVPSHIMTKGTSYFGVDSDDFEATDGKIYSAAQQVHIIRETQTLWYCGIVACQLGHAFTIRGVREPFWRLLPNRNLFISIIFSIGVMLFVVFTPGVKSIFLTRPFPGGYWIGVVLCAVIIGLLVEIKKAMVRAYRRAHPKKNSRKL